jgi:alkyl hydroperoxide reductase subunit AhpC
VRSLPWVASLDKRYRDRGLQVVGLHAPETAREKDGDAVRSEVKRLRIPYPVVMDNDFRMWEALDNRSWPALYLVDRAGRIRFVHVGETHMGTAEALAFEEILKGLLAEPA